MKYVEYAGVKCTYKDSIVCGMVNGQKMFAVVEKCPICGALCGTGLAYRENEKIYEVAGEYARQALNEHMHSSHIVRLWHGREVFQP